MSHDEIWDKRLIVMKNMIIYGVSNRLCSARVFFFLYVIECEIECARWSTKCKWYAWLALRMQIEAADRWTNKKKLKYNSMGRRVRDRKKKANIEKFQFNFGRICRAVVCFVWSQMRMASSNVHHTDVVCESKLKNLRLLFLANKKTNGESSGITHCMHARQGKASDDKLPWVFGPIVTPNTRRTNKMFFCRRNADLCQMTFTYKYSRSYTTHTIAHTASCKSRNFCIIIRVNISLFSSVCNN